MAKTMIASEQITDGQIENVANRLRDALRKHRLEFNSAAVQRALGVKNLGMLLLQPFRVLIEQFGNIIVRRVNVDRNRTPRQALEATGRRLYLNESVVDAMPRGKGKKAEVVFFKPRPEAYRNGFISHDALEHEFDFFGLKPADPYSVAAVNEADPAFADEHPNCTHWKDSDGNWCYAAFNRWNDEPHVIINRYGLDWFDSWWFAGLRK